MSLTKHLQIGARAASSPLTPAQKRFNTLLRQIEQARQTLHAWRENVPTFRQAYSEAVEPLRVKYLAAERQRIVVLDRLLDERGWSASERAFLRDMTCDAAGDFLDAENDDAEVMAEVMAIYDKHSKVDFATGKKQEIVDLKEMTEAFTGFDLGDLDGIDSEEDLAERMFEKMQTEQRAQEAKRTAREQRRRKTPAQARREQEKQQVTQSLREIYRKLVSALHPDRESDPAERERKNALMQKINRAYEDDDLLTLLETQLQIEQIDADHIANISAQRLKQYSQVLQEQLLEIKREIQRLQMEFCMDFDVEPGTPLKPDKLGRLLEEHIRALRADLAQHARDLSILSDRAATKRWIKQARRELRAQANEDFWF